MSNAAAIIRGFGIKARKKNTFNDNEVVLGRLTNILPSLSSKKLSKHTIKYITGKGKPDSDDDVGATAKEIKEIYGIGEMLAAVGRYSDTDASGGASAHDSNNESEDDVGHKADGSRPSSPIEFVNKNSIHDEEPTHGEEPGEEPTHGEEPGEKPGEKPTHGEEPDEEPGEEPTHKNRIITKLDAFRKRSSKRKDVKRDDIFPYRVKSDESTSDEEYNSSEESGEDSDNNKLITIEELNNGKSPDSDEESNSSNETKIIKGLTKTTNPKLVNSNGSTEDELDNSTDDTKDNSSTDDDEPIVIANGSTSINELLSSIDPTKGGRSYNSMKRIKFTDDADDEDENLSKDKFNDISLKSRNIDTNSLSGFLSRTKIKNNSKSLKNPMYLNNPNE